MVQISEAMAGVPTQQKNEEEGGSLSFVGRAYSSSSSSSMKRLTSDEIDQFLQLGTDNVAREMGNIPFEEVLCLPLDQEVVWRRSAVANPDSDLYGISHSSSATVHVLERPKLEKSYLTDGTNIFTTGVVHPGSSPSSSSCSLKVPRKPLLLMRTHFVCDSEIDVVVSNINHILSGILDLSCEFNMESLSVSPHLALPYLLIFPKKNPSPMFHLYVR